MKIMLLLITILLTSCGKTLPTGDFVVKKNNSDRRQFKTTNPIFNEYINSFLDKNYYHTGKDISVSHIPINFGDTDYENSSAIGLCYSWTDGRHEIILNKEWWDTVNEYDRHTLINHELGHCALNRSHFESKYKGVKLSIMHPYHLNSYYYRLFEDGYDKELFTYSQKSLKKMIDTY